MSAASLIQALLPSSTKSASSGIAAIGTGAPGGQSQGGSAAFSLLVPQEAAAKVQKPAAVRNQSVVGSVSSTVEPSTDVVASPKEAPGDASEALIGLLTGTGDVNAPAAGSEAPASQTPGAEPAPHVSPIIEEVADELGIDLEGTVTSESGVPAAPPEGASEVAAVPGTTGTATQDQTAASSVGTAQTAAVLPGAAAGAVPTDQAPPTQGPALASASQQTAPTVPANGTLGPTLNTQGDVLEGGQGAPAAQKLLGLSDGKAASEAAQRDPNAAAAAAGAPAKPAFGVKDGKPAAGQSAAAASAVSGGTQNPFLEERSAALPPEAVRPTAPEPRVPAAATSSPALDASVSQPGSDEAPFMVDQRPPVTVTVRFDQSIHGPQLAAQQMALHIKRNFANGIHRFEVRLDPPELGRIDVRLEMNADGRAAASLTVDRPETLDLLQRDARLLQKALEQAGINLEDSSLNFSLRDENSQSEDKNSQTPGGAGPSGSDVTDEDIAQAGVMEHVAILEEDRVDIRI